MSREGAAQAAPIAALNAGVDLILVSYDPDQYFPVMYALLAADRAGRLRAECSKQRRAAARGPRIADAVINCAYLRVKSIGLAACHNP